MTVVDDVSRLDNGSLSFEDRPDDLRSVAEAASGRFAKATLAINFWAIHTTSDSLPVGPRSLIVDQCLDSLYGASTTLTKAVDRLRREVHLVEWQRNPGNHVLVAANLVRDHDRHKQPSPHEVFPNRNVLITDIGAAAEELRAAYAKYIPEIGASPTKSDVRIIGRFMQAEQRARQNEAIGLVRADMAIAGGSIDPDGRQSQGAARAEIKHRWVLRRRVEVGRFAQAGQLLHRSNAEYGETSIDGDWRRALAASI